MWYRPAKNMELIIMIACCILAAGVAADYGLDQTISPPDAKVGDTVTITCSFTSPANSFLIMVDQRKDGRKKGISTNSYLNYGFKKTGRYNASTETKLKGDATEFIVTITITDAKEEDSAFIECVVPSEGLSQGQELTVSEVSGGSSFTVVGLEAVVTPDEASVGDTVNIICRLTAADLSSMNVRVIKNANGQMKELYWNNFFASEFAATGRFSDEVQISKNSGTKEMILTITMKDIQPGDSGQYGCQVPSMGLVNFHQLDVQSP